MKTSADDDFQQLGSFENLHQSHHILDDKFQFVEIIPHLYLTNLFTVQNLIDSTYSFESLDNKEDRDKDENHIKCRSVMKSQIHLLENEVSTIYSIGCEINQPASFKLKENGVHYPKKFPKIVTYKQYEDNPRCYLLDLCLHLLPHIHAAIRAHHNVIIHCVYGQSRSVSLIVSYLIRYCHYQLTKAIDHVREKKPDISINPGFLTQLYFMEQYYYYEYSIRNYNHGGGAADSLAKQIETKEEDEDENGGQHKRHNSGVSAASSSPMHQVATPGIATSSHSPMNQRNSLHSLHEPIVDNHSPSKSASSHNNNNNNGHHPHPHHQHDAAIQTMSPQEEKRIVMSESLLREKQSIFEEEGGAEELAEIRAQEKLLNAEWKSHESDKTVTIHGHPANDHHHSFHFSDEKKIKDIDHESVPNEKSNSFLFNERDEKLQQFPEYIDNIYNQLQLIFQLLEETYYDYCLHENNNNNNNKLSSTSKVDTSIKRIAISSNALDKTNSLISVDHNSIASHSHSQSNEIPGLLICDFCRNILVTKNHLISLSPSFFANTEMIRNYYTDDFWKAYYDPELEGNSSKNRKNSVNNSVRSTIGHSTERKDQVSYILNHLNDFHVLNTLPSTITLGRRDSSHSSSSHVSSSSSSTVGTATASHLPPQLQLQGEKEKDLCCGKCQSIVGKFYVKGFPLFGKYCPLNLYALQKEKCRMK